MYSQISIARQQIRISSRDLIVRVNQSHSGQQPEQARLFSIADRRVQQLLSRHSAVVDLDCGVAKEESGSRIASIPQNENACVCKRAGFVNFECSTALSLRPLTRGALAIETQHSTPKILIQVSVDVLASRVAFVLFCNPVQQAARARPVISKSPSILTITSSNFTLLSTSFC